jgi:SAM-dependent methyltransferase
MTSWYDRQVLPHIIKAACGCASLADDRRAIVSQATGRVLELGLGAGANLPFYDTAAVREVIGIEPSAELRRIAAEAPRAAGLAVTVAEGEAEALAFDDQAFDTVVCTFTLCTVRDPERTLAEARRVLRPGGAFLFCEHGAAPDPDVARWQRRLEPMWKRLFGGCHLTRPVSGGIGRCFTIDALEAGYQPKAPRFAGWVERGRALAV